MSKMNPAHSLLGALPLGSGLIPVIVNLTFPSGVVYTDGKTSPSPGGGGDGGGGPDPSGGGSGGGPGGGEGLGSPGCTTPSPPEVGPAPIFQLSPQPLTRAVATRTTTISIPLFFIFCSLATSVAFK